MIASNLKRRHLARAQKQVVVAEYVKMFPKRSDQWLGEDLGVGDRLARSQRVRPEATNKVPVYEKLEGKDGITRPRHLKPRTSEVRNAEVDDCVVQPLSAPASEPVIQKPLTVPVGAAVQTEVPMSPATPSEPPR